MSTFSNRVVSTYFLGNGETVTVFNGETRDECIDINVLATRSSTIPQVLGNGCLDLSGVVYAKESHMSCLEGACHSCVPTACGP